MMYFLANYTDTLCKTWRYKSPVSVLNGINSTLKQLSVLSMQCDAKNY